MNIYNKLQTLDFIVIGLYLLMLIVIGVVVSYRRRNEDDQFLGGRSFGWFNVGLSVFGTNVNPSFMIASASAAYTVGMVVANFEWLAWPFLMLLAMVFAPHYLNTKITTMPQFINKRFGPKAADFLSWYALLTTMVLWLGGALYLGGLLFSQIIGWQLSTSVLFLMVISTFLTVAGGLAVVMVTDSFQSILMIIGSATMAIIGFYHIGGLQKLLNAVPPEKWTLFRPMSNPDYPWHAILLGYPVMGVWFWCTDQTIVQRVLGARDLRQGQLGTVFTGFLKIITPFIFVMPGFFCFILHPDIKPDSAFITMVGNYLPQGMKGLIIAVIIAALISTIDSGLNSFSTIFTLDIYKRKFHPKASDKHIKFAGRLVTIIIAIVSIGVALGLGKAGKNLFDLIQSLISYFAPPMAAVFLVGVLWKRATAKAATITLYVGTFASLTIGMLDIMKWPAPGFIYWPGWLIDLYFLPAAIHFLLRAFVLFGLICLFMMFVSVITKHSDTECILPSPLETYRKNQSQTKDVWLGWALLAVIMTGIYILFNWSIIKPLLN